MTREETMKEALLECAALLKQLQPLGGLLMVLADAFRTRTARDWEKIAAAVDALPEMPNEARTDEIVRKLLAALADREKVALTPQTLARSMQDAAKAAQREMPQGAGFFLMAFAFNDPGFPAQYVSNAARANVIAAMREFLARNPMQEMGRN